MEVLEQGSIHARAQRCRGWEGGAPGPPPRGPDLPACPWGVSVRCARACWVVSSPRPLCRGLASPAGGAACPAPPWGAGLGSLSPHLQANGGFASSGSHWGCLEGLRAGPLGPAFVAGGDSDVWGLPVTGRTLGCVQPAGQGCCVCGGKPCFWNRLHVDLCPGEVPLTSGASWCQCVLGGRACEASTLSPAPGHTAEALGADGWVCLVTFSWARVDDVFRGDTGQ